MEVISKTSANLKRRQPKKPSKWRKLIAENGEMAAAAISGVLILGGWVLSTVDLSVASVISYLAAFVIGGYAKAKEGIEETVAEKSLNVELLMVFAAIGSALIGYWAEGAMLIFIFAVSGALETYAMNRSHSEVSKLMALQPEEARLYENGVERKVPVSELRIGQTIIVKPGDLVPVDGTVTDGSTAIDQAAITGESVPVEKKTGDEVLAGTLNVNGGIYVRVDKEQADTLFQKMIKLVQQAQAEKPQKQLFVERFEKIYVNIVIAMTALVAIVPPLALGWTWNDAIYRAMVLLVVASPCALVASVMPALLSAISNGARRGVLFKGGSHLQQLTNIRAIAFDKTGTLTRGVPEVQEVIPFADFSEEQLLANAASIEQLSTHPLAEAIVRQAQVAGVSFVQPQGMISTTGFGVEAKIDGTLWKIGKRDYMDVSFGDEVEEARHRLASEGKTAVYIQCGEQLVGMLAIQDAIRPKAAAAVAALKKLGIHTVMITGDSEETARALAKQCAVDRYYANCLPDEKVNIVRELQQTHGQIAMVGDGVNDAPALATASVGIGMGAGTDAALETADVVLVNDELKRLPYVIKLAKRSDTIIKQNIVFSIGVILTLIVANFLDSMTLPLGVIGHEGSTILVILNGLRLLKYKE
ncbi:heavy metal translocating P-type ATPase [Numidum massiliense]|uniref:heavy metal translocating P-type ATPase n=1 Tax=Numidum massiliense TaxID=1522315 RepID=UPI0009E83A48|nr:heavy metal translocating P-type ATPase [Numidum massiliense]